MNEKTSTNFLRNLKLCLSRADYKTVLRDMLRRTLADGQNFNIVPLGVTVRQLLEILEDPFRELELNNLLARIDSVLADVEFRDGMEDGKKA
jgi:hypothetical protein